MTVPATSVFASIRPDYDLRAAAYGSVLTYDAFQGCTVIRLSGTPSFRVTIDHSADMAPLRVDGRPLFDKEAEGDDGAPALQTSLTDIGDGMLRLRVDSLAEPCLWLEVTFVVYED